VTAVDDHPIVVEGLASLLTRAPGRGGGRAARSAGPTVEWLGQSRTLTELRAKLAEWDEPPDLVFYDLNLGDGSDPAEGIASLNSDGIAVVVLTSELRSVPIRRAIAAGAAGLVLKSDDLDRILDVVRSVSLGNFAVSSDLAFVLATDEDMVPHLAPRELEVLRLLADGVPRKSVGNRLDPPVKLATVVTYLNRICTRYQENGRAVATSQDAIRAAVEDGYFDFPGTGRGRADESGPVSPSR
ncbi:MAG: hypothetical protein ACQERF_10855, partial [Actinomycetota bacterium]